MKKIILLLCLLNITGLFFSAAAQIANEEIHYYHLAVSRQNFGGSLLTMAWNDSASCILTITKDSVIVDSIKNVSASVTPSSELTPPCVTFVKRGSAGDAVNIKAVIGSLSKPKADTLYLIIIVEEELTPEWRRNCNGKEEIINGSRRRQLGPYRAWFILDGEKKINKGMGDVTITLIPK
jgi:hypothetical protein